MSFDTQTSFMSGGLAMSIVGYGLFSAFVTGPEILLREADKIGWSKQCARLVRLEVQDNAPQSQQIPNIDVGRMMDGLFGNGGRQIIAPFEGMINQAQRQANRARDLNEERLRRKIEAAGSRCGCAVAVLSEQRISLGLYAASGRLITPTLFKNLNSELQTALRSARCANSS